MLGGVIYSTSRGEAKIAAGPGFTSIGDWQCRKGGHSRDVQLAADAAVACCALLDVQHRGVCAPPVAAHVLWQATAVAHCGMCTRACCGVAAGHPCLPRSATGCRLLDAAIRGDSDALAIALRYYRRLPPALVVVLEELVVRGTDGDAGDAERARCVSLLGAHIGGDRMPVGELVRGAIIPPEWPLCRGAMLRHIVAGCALKSAAIRDMPLTMAALHAMDPNACRLHGGNLHCSCAHAAVRRNARGVLDALPRVFSPAELLHQFTRADPPLVLAVRRRAPENVLQAIVSLTRHVLEPVAVATAFFRALVCAVLQHERQVVVYLTRDCGVDIDAMTSGGRTVLMIAAGVCNRAAVMHLLRLGANPLLRSPGADPRTALRFACEGGRVEIVEALLDRGCVPARADLVAAASHGRRRVLALLLDDVGMPMPVAGSDDEADIVAAAVRSGRMGAIKALVLRGACVPADARLPPLWRGRYAVPKTRRWLSSQRSLPNAVDLALRRRARHATLVEAARQRRAAAQ